ncbi:dsRNA-specific ribonuclease [Trichocoleus sp. FACHB-591]|uniref:ribonuclease III domain-containing protein n=1 Tax=Trichocoleus sp. FACHB-591 TaxID=2692872 RepID=UPI001686E630|nr:ribonuclease III domain-containing protein [Trichocoleus sp. FACHB-591]MBD2094447.1 dsRNA-specific ribonuclease [Trichocoleus sp. FACHB-591]
MKPEDIAVVERRLNYTFNDKNLLIRALTRKAFAQEQRQQGRNCQDQELYRILGDAVLKSILVEMLIQQGYDSRESITNKKIELEKRENLGRMFEEMGIASFIRLGIGEKKQGISRQSSVLGETFEALVAAVHIDAGSYEKTKRFVIDLFSEPVLDSPKHQASDESSGLDAISKIWMQSNVCDSCFQPDVCSTVRMCHFDNW